MRERQNNDLLGKLLFKLVLLPPPETLHLETGEGTKRDKFLVLYPFAEVSIVYN